MTAYSLSLSLSLSPHWLIADVQKTSRPFDVSSRLFSPCILPTALLTNAIWNSLLREATRSRVSNVDNDRRDSAFEGKRASASSPPGKPDSGVARAYPASVFNTNSPSVTAEKQEPIGHCIFTWDRTEDAVIISSLERRCATQHLPIVVSQQVSSTLLRPQIDGSLTAILFPSSIRLRSSFAATHRATRRSNNERWKRTRRPDTYGFLARSSRQPP